MNNQTHNKLTELWPGTSLYLSHLHHKPGNKQSKNAIINFYQ